MKLLLDPQGKQAVMIFGLGNVGSSINSKLQKNYMWIDQDIEYPWSIGKQFQRHQFWDSQISAFEHIFHDVNYDTHIVWSAGKAGMSASDQEIKQQKKLFMEFINQVIKLHATTASRLHMHLLSSAGALFEGVRRVGRLTAANPKRAYGDLKLFEENFIKRIDCDSLSVYRLASVFSSFRDQYRNGLIPTLIRDASVGATSKIWGRMDTLRDYIWVNDVGDFIANRILRKQSWQTNTFLLASGKPTSVREVISSIEACIHRPIAFTRVAASDKNDLDITFQRNAIAPELKITPLDDAIAAIHSRA